MTTGDSHLSPTGPTYEWRVRYRRRWWHSVQARLFQSAPPARRLIDKLRRPRCDLEPVVVLDLQRRVVGEWEDVERVINEWDVVE